MVKFEYKEKHTFEIRNKKAKMLLEKYPGSTPIICQVDPKITNFEKNWFVVPGEMTVGQFMCVLRKRVRMSSTCGLFLFLANGTIPKSAQLLTLVYSQHHDEDGFLYFYVTRENTFGNIFR
ncbi:ubiquitin-related domain-containing protein [Catenaria anguillulae PL171]|uniref:Autophagy-related protein n=1 Tax=Catenaria anguillulae PL171 TaxID=765915 RepID=A0A1Y2GSD1_9FUNG|nr:ubiquitin-related domain-containing protein [Catenaria anguillulae PL171]